MKNVIFSLIILFIIGAISSVGLYYYYPRILVRFSPNATLAYYAFLKSHDSKEWEIRMSRNHSTDYAWLLNALKDMKDDTPRFVSAWSLGVMGNQGAIPHLIDCLQSDPSVQVRYTSARALGALQAKVAIPILITAINDGDTTVRNVAVEVLGDLGAKEAISTIENAKRTYQYPSMEYAADAALKKLK